MQMINEEKYKAIFKEKAENPHLAITTLCSKHGTTYQSYNNWLKKTKSAGAVPPVEVPVGRALRIVVHLSVGEIVDMVTRNETQVVVPLTTVIRGLSPAERDVLNKEYGARAIQALHKMDLEPYEDGSAIDHQRGR